MQQMSLQQVNVAFYHVIQAVCCTGCLLASCSRCEEMQVKMLGTLAAAANTNQHLHVLSKVRLVDACVVSGAEAGPHTAGTGLSYHLHRGPGALARREARRLGRIIVSPTALIAFQQSLQFTNHSGHVISSSGPPASRTHAWCLRPGARRVVISHECAARINSVLIQSNQQSNPLSRHAIPVWSTGVYWSTSKRVTNVQVLPYQVP